MSNDVINLGTESHRDGTTIDYIFKKSNGKFYAIVHGFAIGQNSSNRSSQLKVNTIEDLQNDLKGKNIKWSKEALGMFPQLKENRMKKLTLKERKLVKEYIQRLKNKMPLNEATEFDINDLPIGGILTFEDGETWKVMKRLGSSTHPSGYLIAPYGETKKHYISLHIEITIKKLSDELVSVA